MFCLIAMGRLAFLHLVTNVLVWSILRPCKRLNMFTREQHITRRRFSSNKNVPLLHLFCMASIYQCKTSIRSKYFLAHGQLNRRSWNATNRSNQSHPIMSDTDTDKTILISFIFVMIVKMKQNFLFGEYRLNCILFW